jgi:hypothetical protein
MPEFLVHPANYFNSLHVQLDGLKENPEPMRDAERKRGSGGLGFWKAA